MRTIIATIIMLLGALPAGSSLARSIWSPPLPDEPEAYKIVQYLEHGDLVVINAGRSDGIIEGTTLNTFRASARSATAGSASNSVANVWVETGVIKVLDVQKESTIARVEENSSDMSKAFFPEFPGVMAGDLAVRKEIRLARRQAVTPTVAVGYHEIFQDPTSRPKTFELSKSGRQEVAKAAKAFADAHLSLLMVEGYTDHKGPSAANQVESYQRALTVRQYLISQLGFDGERVMAIGYGESEQADDTMAPGYVNHNRRIVFKAVPVN